MHAHGHAHGHVCAHFFQLLQKSSPCVRSLCVPMFPTRSWFASPSVAAISARTLHISPIYMFNSSFLPFSILTRVSVAFLSIISASHSHYPRPFHVQPPLFCILFFFSLFLSLPRALRRCKHASRDVAESERAAAPRNLNLIKEKKEGKKEEENRGRKVS